MDQNPYEGIIPQTPEITAAPASVENPYAEIVGPAAQSTKETAASNLYKAQGVNPDEYGRALQVGQDLGLHPDTVVPQLPELQAQKDLQAKQDLVGRSTALSQFLANEINAKVAQDDLDKLGFFERSWDSLKSGRNRSKLEYELGWIGTRKGLGSASEKDNIREAELRAQLQTMPQFSGYTGHLQKVAGFFGGLEKNVETASVVALGPAAVGAGVGALAGGVGAGPGFVAGYTWGLGTGILADMARGAYGDTYTRLGEIKDDAGNGISEPARQLGAIIAGAGTFAVGKMGGAQVADTTLAGARALITRSLEDAVRRPTVARAFGQFAKALSEAGLEGAALNGMMVTANQVGEQIARFVTPTMATIFTDPAQQEAFKENLTNAMIEGLELFPYMKLPGATMGLVGDTLRARQARIDAQVLSEFAKGVPESKTRNRALSSFLDFMHLQTDGTLVENMFVDANAVMALYQKSGVDPFSLDPKDDPLLGWLPDRNQQLREALARNGEIVVPSAEFVGRLGGSDAFAELLQDVRVRPDGFTLREASNPEVLRGAWENAANAAQQFKQNYEQELRQVEPAQRVFNDVYTQLLNANVVAGEASKYATLMAHRYAARAERLPGVYPDAWTAYEKSALRIRGEIAPGVGLNQEAAIPKTPEENIQRGSSAMERVISGKEDVLNAMHRPEVGGISFYWGDRGKGAKFKGGHGVAKIIAKHGEDVARMMPEVIAKGELGEIQHVPSGDRIKIHYAGHTAQLSLYKFGERETWLLTGWEDVAPDVSGKGSDLSGPTHEGPIRTRSTVGAGAERSENIAPLGKDGKPLFQNPKGWESVEGGGEPRRARASLQLPESGYGTGLNSINLFAAKNRSSFLHEASHLWLEELIHDAQHSELAAADLQAVKNWFIVHADQTRERILSEWNAAVETLGRNPSDQAAIERANAFRGAAHFLESDPDAIRNFVNSLDHTTDRGRLTMALLTPLHELFARHGEAYFMEGKAPAPGLQSVFESFRSWLKRIYERVAGRGRQMLGLSQDSGMPIEVSPEIRGIMDRLIATDEQIDIMRQRQRLGNLFKSAEQAGMTAAEFAAYNKLVAKARDDARAAVQARAMRDLAKQRSEEWAAKAEEFRPEVEAQINSRSDLQTLHYLRTGKLLGAEDTGEAAIRVHLNRDALAALIGKDALRNLPFGIYRVEGGADPQAVAEMFGYKSGTEMARDLLALEAARRDLRNRNVNTDLRQHLIQEALTARLQDHFKDVMADGSLPEEAMHAVHNDASTQALAMELRALIRQNGMSRPIFGPAADAKRWAEQVIGQRRVSDVLSLSRFARDEAKAAQAAEMAMAKGDLPMAISQQQARLMNHALYVAAQKANDALEKLVSAAGKYGKKRAIKSLDQDALDQIHNLLERFGMKQPDPNAKRMILGDWLARQQDMGTSVVVPESLFDPKISGVYKDMTVGQALDLATAIKSIAHVGREAKKITMKGKRVEFEAVRDELATSAYKNLKVTDVPRERNPGVVQGDFGQRTRTKFKNVGGALAGLHSSLLKIEGICDELDGHNPLGPWNTAFFRRASEQENWANTWRNKMAEGLRALQAVYPKEEQRKLSQFLPDILELPDNMTGEPLRITRGELLSIALNWGNESNRSKLLRGEGWGPEAVQAVFDRHMTKADWDFVQGIWDLIETLRPEIAAREKRMTGVEPVWVDAAPVQTPWGEYRGGYYPMAYDPRRAGDVADRIMEQAEAFMSQSKAGRPTTDKGYTEARKERYTRPVLLSLDVLTRHMDNVIRDLAWREYVYDTVRLIRDPRVREAMVRTVGQAQYDQVVPWIRGMIGDRTYDKSGNNFWMNLAHGARMRTTMVDLGYRASTMLVHGMTALSNSIGELGPKWMMVGAKAFFGGPEKMATARDFIYARSAEMKARMEHVDRDIVDALRESYEKDGILDGVKKFAYHGVAMLDMASALPTWIGAYERALAPKEKGGLGMNEADAIYSADKAVRNAHGGAGAKDLAAVQRGNEYQKLTTIFYSFWSHFYNRQIQIGRDFRRAGAEIISGDRAKGAQDFSAVLARSFWYFIIPQVIHGLIKEGAPGEDDSWLVWAAEEIGIGFFSGIPVLRDVVNAAKMGRAYTVTPAASMYDALAMTKKDVSNWTTGDPVSEKWLKHTFNTTGYIFGLPTGQAGQTLQYLWDIWEGNERPEEVSEFMKGFIFGAKHKKH